MASVEQEVLGPNEGIKGDSWYVVLEGTGREHSNHLGVVTVVPFKDADDFERFMTEHELNDIVLAQGLSQADAQNYRRTSAGARKNAAIREATSCDGTFNPELFKATSFNGLYALALERQDDGINWDLYLNPEGGDFGFLDEIE